MQKEYGEKADEYTEVLFRKAIEDGNIRPCDSRALAEVFNAFRFAWLYQTFILDFDKPRETGSMEKDLRAPIELFEQLLEP